jgi:hypothetical protein
MSASRTSKSPTRKYLVLLKAAIPLETFRNISKHFPLTGMIGLIASLVVEVSETHDR